MLVSLDSTMCAGLMLSLLLPLTLVSAGPCCTDNNEMVHINNSVYCQDDLSLISIYKWCLKFYTVDPQEPEEDEVFLENSDKTEASLDGETWVSKYCTGTFSNESTSDTHIAHLGGKELGLICFDEPPDEDHLSVYAICLLASSVFLLFTLVIYLVLPELRDLQGKCVMCSILSLMIGYVCLAYLQLPFTSPEIAHDMECVILAFLTYFWMLSAFFWLNINSFNMWRSSVLAHINMSERKLMMFYYMAGWGLPLGFLAVAIITHNMPGKNIIRPNFGISSCWFKGKLELWSYFYGPVLVLLIFNIVYFISTALHLWSDYRSPNPMPRIKSLRIKFVLYFKLFLVMGITWIFEILSSIANEPWYVTDILNCFQGVIVFVVMIVLRKRVWRALAAKKFCGIQFPHCWERMEDDEETVNDDDDVHEHQLAPNNCKS